MPADAVEILLNAHANNRLHHGILLHGPDTRTLEAAFRRVAGRLLNRAPDAVATHPDLFTARPSGKARRIAIDDVREIIRQIQQSPNAGERKVAVLYDADRMTAECADTFLKTLEEPPADTTIFLLSTRPRRLLDTVRSRCLQFFIAGTETDPDPDWDNWLLDFDDWIVDLSQSLKFTRTRAATLIFTLYALLTRFESLLAGAVAARWEMRKAELAAAKNDAEAVAPDKEEIEAEEAGLAKDIRLRRTADIALRLCAIYDRGVNYCATNNISPDPAAARILHASFNDLDRAAVLTDLNLKGPADLEYAFLRILRHWTVRG